MLFLFFRPWRKVVHQVPARKWADAALVGAAGCCGQLSGSCFHGFRHFSKTGFRSVELPRLGVVERLVDPLMIVVVHPFTDTCIEFDQVVIGTHADALAFERTPLVLDENMIHPASASIHADHSMYAIHN